MFVVSGVESGDKSEVVAPPLPHVIGYIQTAIGGGTLGRANGIAAPVIVGDPICQGDVLETAAGGRIGLRFIDNTVFDLSCSTRVVVNEFACDSTDAFRSATFGVSRGAFAFIAGQVAESGCFKVDTPLGSIRSRTRSVGIGALSVAALTFSIMKEVQAADPSVTFLDEDSITYKDLEHGVFELITKEAIPRHLFVDDPGATVVLRPQGSTISVNQTTNSAAKMAELQVVQQEALATFAKGPGPNGSGTPPPANSLPLQPINFILPDGSTPALNSLASAPWVPISVQEINFGHLPPQPPSLNAVAGPTETDTVVFDVFTATRGTLAASSSSGGALTFGVSGGISGSTVLDGVTYDVSSAGPYGRLYINSTTGAYTFVPDSGAINALTTPTTANFTVTVSDGTLSAQQVFTIAINGINDAAIVSGTTTGSVIEAGGVANTTSGTPTATGTLADADVDDPPNTFTAVSSPTASAGGYGTFTMTTAGVWTYTLDNSNNAVQALHLGDTLTDSFTVTTVDGTPQIVTITINGVNDTAVIVGATTGSVIEAGGVANGTLGTPTATGTLTDADVDNASNTFTAVSSSTASAGGYGAFTITAAGVWTYTLNNVSTTVQALNVGDTLTDSFTVTTVDGTPQIVTITIHGTNDAAVISGSTTGSVIEAGGVANATSGTPTAAGTLTDADVDNTSNTFTAVSSPKASAGGYGTFTMTAAGAWLYTLDNSNSAVQALNVGGTLTDSFTVTTVDGTAQLVTVTVHGTNDAAVISGTTTGSVIEAGGVPTSGMPTATGTLTDTDVDNTPNTFTAVSSQTASDGGYGTFTMTAAGVWTYRLDDANSTVQALDVGDTLTDSFTVTTADGTTQIVTITIHGASDADPNDFDNLATGTVVVSDPPFVYGTPGHDSIAGGGNDGQTIYGGAGDDTLNGTGRADLIFAGSGNDTIKGNDGDDTIYGGSGSDTINANNGNDIIIGGYGADNLTGSNGDDRFVYLSVADSNSAQFDVISDFRLGSDRIDLAALGALAFLALTSSSTSVPAHTVAWIYDSTANETVVYVNPTDQTLSIGDSSLLEIHLQGVVSVEPSDFVYVAANAPADVAGESISLELAATSATDGTAAAMTTSDVSLDTTSSDSANLGDGNLITPTTNTGDSSDEVRTNSIEYSIDDATITLAEVQSIKPHGVYDITAPMGDNFAFDQHPVLDGTGAMTIGGWAELHPVEHDGWIALSNGHRNIHSETNLTDTSGDENHAVSNGHHFGTDKFGLTNTGADHAGGPTVDTDPKEPEAPSKHGHAVASAHANSAADGAATKHGAGGADSKALSIADAVFGSNVDSHRDSFHFADNISGVGDPDTANLTDLDFAPTSSHHEDGTESRAHHAASQDVGAIGSSQLEDHSAKVADVHGMHDLMV